MRVKHLFHMYMADATSILAKSGVYISLTITVIHNPSLLPTTLDYLVSACKATLLFPLVRQATCTLCHFPLVTALSHLSVYFVKFSNIPFYLLNISAMNSLFSNSVFDFYSGHSILPSITHVLLGFSILAISPLCGLYLDLFNHLKLLLISLILTCSTAPSLMVSCSHNHFWEIIINWPIHYKSCIP